MELSRWHTANLLLPVSQVAREGGGGVYYNCKAGCVCVLQCLKTLALSASTLMPHSLHISRVESGGGQKLAQTSTVAS